ncbi:phenylacetate-CoA oxygenase subunit PaaC [Xenorhabdus nematophila]|nr:phenylacetic acid degradation protein [Xenorhabdus nematophila]MBA0018822.1 phenylacetate-CoA oxygenase subunit PaaC [Xenorhabdus nematophila]MCB4426531.1 phenylacetate-CoA oxygenase subunit PaaC [Xenorhabdus nematophila]
MKKALTEYLLRLGDNALILSQQLCGWCGHAPTLEEELALSNIALDLLGQSRLWLDAAGRTMTPIQSEDDLAYKRNVQDFRNVLLVELNKGNFADTQVRQFLFDSWHFLLLRELSKSLDQEVAAIATKALKEVTYHLRRSSSWIVRLGDGNFQSNLLCRQAIDLFGIYVNELFEMDDVEELMLSQGIGCDLAAIYPEWLAYVNEVLITATLDPLSPKYNLSGGKKGSHSESLVGLLMEMQFLTRAYPGATW